MAAVTFGTCNVRVYCIQCILGYQYRCTWSWKVQFENTFPRLFIKNKMKNIYLGEMRLQIKKFFRPTMQTGSKIQRQREPRDKNIFRINEKSKIYIRWLKNKKSTRWQRLFSKVHKVCNQRINSAYQWFFALARLSIYEFWNFSSQII